MRQLARSVANREGLTVVFIDMNGGKGLGSGF